MVSRRTVFGRGMCRRRSSHFEGIGREISIQIENEWEYAGDRDAVEIVAEQCRVEYVFDDHIVLRMHRYLARPVLEVHLLYQRGGESDIRL